MKSLRHQSGLVVSPLVKGNDTRRAGEGARNARRAQYPADTLLAVFVAMLFVGCGSTSDGGPERVPFSGAVTRNGDPVAAGFVSFQPAGEQPSSPPANVPIVNGRYEFDANNGPAEGDYRVIVNVSHNRALQAKEGVPPVETTQWEFEISVTRNGDFQADFDLTPANAVGT